jgi:hypothetical protein
MKFATITAIACLSLLGACALTKPADSAKMQSSAVEAYQSYGAKIDASAAQSLASLVPLESQDTKQIVKVSGRIGQVCQAEGCWMMLTDGDIAVRVKFGDHAFVIPKDAQGNAIARGQFEITEMSEAHAKHMAEDAGTDPSKVIGAQKEVRFMADAVLIERDS